MNVRDTFFARLHPGVICLAHAPFKNLQDATSNTIGLGMTTTQREQKAFCSICDHAFAGPPDCSMIPRTDQQTEGMHLQAAKQIKCHFCDQIVQQS